MRATAAERHGRIGATLGSALVLAMLATGIVGCTTPGDGGTCTPITCEEAAKTCGIIDDHCGGNLFCGRCDAPAFCDPNNNVCGCMPDASSCAGKCGKIIDNCGQPMDCGGCTGGDNCGGGGPNVCGAGTCTPLTCAGQSKDCGSIADGCGELLPCGSCTDPKTCGGGGVANVCGCKPITCDQLSKNCGSIPDTCGGTLDCGTCAGDKTCGGGGIDNVCGGPGPSKVVHLTWMAPTTNTDGSALPPTNIGGYRLYFGLASGTYGPPVDVGDVVTHNLAGLPNGATYYFAVTTYDIFGNESTYSNEATVTLP